MTQECCQEDSFTSDQYLILTEQADAITSPYEQDIQFFITKKKKIDTQNSE